MDFLAMTKKADADENVLVFEIFSLVFLLKK